MAFTVCVPVDSHNIQHTISTFGGLTLLLSVFNRAQGTVSVCHCIYAYTGSKEKQ